MPEEDKERLRRLNLLFRCLGYSPVHAIHAARLASILLDVKEIDLPSIGPRLGVSYALALQIAHRMMPFLDTHRWKARKGRGGSRRVISLNHAKLEEAINDCIKELEKLKEEINGG